MPITYRQQGGGRIGVAANVQRPISSIDGNTGIVTTTAAITTVPLVGSIMEIFGTTTIKNNKGFFTCTAVSGATYTLRPKPITQGASGTLGRCNDYSEYTLAASAISEVLVYEFNTSLAYIRVAGGNFKTAGVRANDRVYLSGSSITKHNGAWIIQEVISNTVLLVRSSDKGEFMQTEASGTGSIRIFQGRIRVEISNIGNNSWNRIKSEATVKKGPYSSKFYTFGSGEISDYIYINTIGDGPTGEQRTFVQLEGIAAVTFYQSTPSDLTFYSLDELVVSSSNTGPVGACKFGEVSGSLWPGTLTVELGNNPGNRFSSSNGSIWIAVAPNVRLNQTGIRPNIPASVNTNVNLYGSYLDLSGTQEVTLREGNIIASIVRPKANLGTGLIESAILYGDTGNAAAGLGVDDSGNQSNILLCNQGSQSAISAAGIIEGLLVSNTTVDIPFINTSGGEVEFRDPREDYDAANLITNSTGTAIKTYQFNPRFVSQDSPDLTPVPIFYLTVDVIQINEEDLVDVVAVIHDTTNLEGRLVGGARYLLRQNLDVTEDSTLYSHRVVLNGAGFKIQNSTVQLDGPLVGDWTVPRISPDYESEFGE